MYCRLQTEAQRIRKIVIQHGLSLLSKFSMLSFSEERVHWPLLHFNLIIVFLSFSVQFFLVFFCFSSFFFVQGASHKPQIPVKSKHTINVTQNVRGPSTAIKHFRKNYNVDQSGLKL